MSMLVTKKTLGELVASRIRDYILEQGLKSGDRLPTEQQFAEMFGVSRVVVREATKSLGYLGIIRAAPRRGLSVGTMDNGKLRELLTFHYALSRIEPAALLKTLSVLVAGTLQIGRNGSLDDAGWAEMATLAGRAESEGLWSEGEQEFTRTLLERLGCSGVAFYATVVMAGLRSAFGKGRKKSEGKGALPARTIVERLREGKFEEAQSLWVGHLNALMA